MRGNTRPSVGHSHQVADTSKAMALAASATCDPEIAIRWVSPAARRMVQSASSRPRVSPSASARTKREVGDGMPVAIRTDMRSRHASMPRGGPSWRGPASART
jgi:hypothetical protein